IVMELRKHLEEATKRGSDSGVGPERGLLTKESLQEMKKELASLLHTAEKAFGVELLALPMVMRKMRRKDLINLKEEEVAAATVAANLEVNDCCVRELSNPKLVRTNSKRVKVTTIVEYKDEKDEIGTQAKKSTQKRSKDEIITCSSNQFHGFCFSSGLLLYTVLQRQEVLSDLLLYVNNQYLPPSALKEQPGTDYYFIEIKPVRTSISRALQRGHSQNVSASEKTRAATLRSSSMPHERSIPFVNIPLADGQTLCSAGDDLQNINVELLNDDTVQHIHTLVFLLFNNA
ncbi:hypothetical protein JD844_000379, partial [Phrynosoma platyrhinos]